MSTAKSWRNRSEADGYLSLVLSAFLYLIPYLPDALEVFKLPLGLVVLGAVVRYAIRGITRGHGGGKRAARLSLTTLLLMFLACLCLTLIELTRIVIEGGYR